MKQSDLVKELGKGNYKKVRGSLEHYFGDKKLVRGALKNANYKFFASEEEYRELMKPHIKGEALKGWSNKENLYQSSASVFSNFIMVPIDNERLEIRGQTPTVFCPKLTDLDPNDYNSLVHELCHLIKSFCNPTIVTKDGFIRRNGLIEYIYEMYMNDEEIFVDQLQTKGRAIEEAFTSIQAEEIIEYYLFPKEEIEKDEIYKEYYKKIYYCDDFRRSLFLAELYGDKERLIERFNRLTSNSWQLFEDGSDELYVKYINSHTDEEVIAVIEEYNKFFHDILNPMYDEYISKAKERKLIRKIWR